MARSRKARPQDIHAIASALPQVEFGTSWGDRPTYKVGGRGFVLYRAPRHDAVDPDTGQEHTDLVVIVTASAEDKAALVESDGPFFTIDHFRSYNAVLVSQARLGEISREELAEVIADAWLARAPKRLATQYLAASADGSPLVP